MPVNPWDMKGMSYGFEGMSEELDHLVHSAMSMIDSPGQNVNPMYHLHGVKQAFDGTKVGRDVIAVMDDRRLWMPTAMMFCKNFGGAEWAAMMADAHMKFVSVGKDEDIPNIAPGDLKRMADAGDIEVKDCALVTMRRDNGTEESATVYYTVDEGGSLVWTPPMWFVSEEATALSGKGLSLSCLQVMLGHRPPTREELAEVLWDMAEMRREGGDMRVTAMDLKDGRCES